MTSTAGVVSPSDTSPHDFPVSCWTSSSRRCSLSSSQSRNRPSQRARPAKPSASHAGCAARTFVGAAPWQRRRLVQDDILGEMLGGDRRDRLAVAGGDGGVEVGDHGRTHDCGAARSLYMASISAAYLASIGLRLSFIVGV